MIAVDTPSLEGVLDSIQRFGFFACDLEARAPEGRPAKDATDPRVAVLTHVVIGTPRTSIVLPAGEPAYRLLRTLFGRRDLTAVVHYALYDLVVLHERGVVREQDIRCRVVDTMIQQFLLHEREDRGLKELVRRHLRHRMVTYDEVTSDNQQQRRLDEIDDLMADFAKKAKRFPRVRPWPSFDSPDVIESAWFRAKCAETRDSTCPGTVDEKGRRRWTAEERAERARLAAYAEARIEELFGTSAQAAFAAWAEQRREQLRSEADGLRARLDEMFVAYAEADGLWTARLHKCLRGKLRRARLDRWEIVESGVRMASVRMSVRGSPIDLDYLRKFSADLGPVIVDLRAAVFDIAKQEFDVDSPQQLRRVLFYDLRLFPPVVYVDQHGRAVPKLTDTAQKLFEDGDLDVDLNRPETITDDVRLKYLSSDRETLERLAHPIGIAVLNYRVATKLQSTYADAVIDRVAAHPEHRLCGIFNSIGAEKTGRFSSSDPNLQNIPSRGKSDRYDVRIRKLGMTIRRAYRAPRGYKLIIADMSQIELRGIAHITGDRRMRQIYEERVVIDGAAHYVGDIHRTTSKELQIERKNAKPINFGFTYGMGPLRFCRQTPLYKPGTFDFDIDRARDWREGFLTTYSGLREFFHFAEDCWDAGAREARLMSGRIRHFVREDYQFGITGGKILNAVVQGGCADMLKAAIYAIEKYVVPAVPTLQLLFQVHDELGFMVPEEHAAFAGELIKYALERPWLPFTLPLLASVKVCDSWAEKDDDAVPEIGGYYAKIADVGDRVFTPADWSEYLRFEKDGRVGVKAAGASLSVEQVRRCAAIVPDRLEEMSHLTEPVMPFDPPLEGEEAAAAAFGGIFN